MPKAKRAEVLAFLQLAMRETGNACLLWPFGRGRTKGREYGVLHLGKTVVGAHRFICECVYGSHPSDKPEAAHSCGNPNCVNPKHLRWDSHRGNLADRDRHGTKLVGEDHGNAKLTERQVTEIRLLYGTIHDREIATKYGIARQSVRPIATGRSWKHSYGRA